MEHKLNYRMLLKIFTKRKFSFILYAYFLIQLLLVLMIHLPFFSDSLTYYNLAEDCLIYHSLYPGMHNLYDSYIIAPVYVNWLILILNIYNSPITIFSFNILLNMLQLFLLIKIAKLIFMDEVSHRIAGIIYILYLSSLGAVLMNLTELLFGVLLLAAYYFYLKGRTKNFIISGILIGLAVGVRQIGLAFVVSIIIYEFVLWRESKKINRGILYLILSMCAVFIFLGFSAKARTGYYVSAGTNESVNILMGAHDDANGSYKDLVFQKGKAGYLHEENNLTYFYKSEYWNKKAMEWIIGNPTKWLSLIPAKILHTVVVDDWSVFALTGTADINLYKIAKGFVSDGNFRKVFGVRSTIFITCFLILYIYHHLFYYLIFALMVYCFGKMVLKKNKTELNKYLIPYLFSFFCFAATAIAVGAPRYKYPVMIILILTIVPFIKVKLKL
jgi:hypothetical protein